MNRDFLLLYCYFLVTSAGCGISLFVVSLQKKHIYDLIYSVVHLLVVSTHVLVAMPGSHSLSTRLVWISASVGLFACWLIAACLSKCRTFQVVGMIGFAAFVASVFMFCHL
jgi:hypothetical protein